MTRFLSAAVLFLSLSLSISAADWPQWRGPDRDGVAPGAKVPAKWSADAPPAKWKAAVGEGYSSPAIAGGGAVTSLVFGVSATATTLTVANGAAIASGPCAILITIGGERMLVTNASGNPLTVIRGYNGTHAAAHKTNAAVYLVSDQRGVLHWGRASIGAYQA